MANQRARGSSLAEEFVILEYLGLRPRMLIRVARGNIHKHTHSHTHTLTHTHRHTHTHIPTYTSHTGTQVNSHRPVPKFKHPSGEFFHLPYVHKCCIICLVVLLPRKLWCGCGCSPLRYLTSCLKRTSVHQPAPPRFSHSGLHFNDTRA